jgi:hypothetical protein
MATTRVYLPAWEYARASHVTSAELASRYRSA